ncbi:MAG: hypothetical protein QM426_04850 [Euryarchaeota archaeon]|nr:hypothetical protein [Euryarchaeota archaeon]
MQTDIPGSESFRARSLPYSVKTRKRKVLIDPGAALARFVTAYFHILQSL